LRLLLLAQLVALAAPAYAQSSPPAVSILAAPQTLIDPSAAPNQYGTSVTHTVGIAARPTTAPEIVALARSLGSEQLSSGAITSAQYTQRVYEWVRNNVETEFHFGLGKGGIGALIDLHGSAFDQAELMVMLLRQAGVAASYQIGTLSVSSPVAFGHWTGLVKNLTAAPAPLSDPYSEFSAQSFDVDAKSACLFLADGGIPATVNGATSCSSLSGNLTSATVYHVWVIVGAQIYDPSYKMHLLKPGIDLPAAMACGTAGSSTCGNVTASWTNGATLGTQNGATSITLSASGRSDSTNANTPGTPYSNQWTSLYNTIKSTATTATATDVVGGMDIAPSSAAATYAASQVSYAANATWSGDIPDQYRTTLSVSAPSVGTCTFFGDELAGQRLFIWGRQDGSGGSNAFVEFAVEQRGMTKATNPPCAGGGYTPPPAQVRLAVDHPYRANNGTYADRSIDFAIVEPAGQPQFDISGVINYSADGAGGSFFPSGTSEASITGSFPILVMGGFGDAMQSTEQRMNDLNTAAPSTKYGTCVSSTSLSAIEGWCSARSMPVTAEALRARTTSLDRLLKGITKTRIIEHDQLGLIYSSRGSSSKYLSVSTGLSIQPLSMSDTTARARAFELAALAIPKLESESISDPYNRTTLFRTGPTSSQTIYLIPPTAMAGFLAGIPYGASQNTELYYFEQQWRSRLQVAANAGFTTLMNGQLNTNSLQEVDGEAFFRGNDIAYTFWAGVKGGNASDPLRVTMNTVQVSKEAKPRPSYSSVNLADGALSFSPPSDLITGVGDFPLSLPFQRTYKGGSVQDGQTETLQYVNAANQGQMAYAGGYSPRYIAPDQEAAGRLGGGWTHNYNVTARLSLDLGRALGEQGGIDAAQNIATLVEMNDLAQPADITGRVKLYLLQQYIGSSGVALVRKGGTSETLVSRPGGYVSLEGSAKMTYSGSIAGVVSFPQTLTYTDGDGNTIVFNGVVKTQTQSCYYLFWYPKLDPVYPAASWTFANGVKLAFTYDNADYWDVPPNDFDGCQTSTARLLRSVSNSLGRSLTFNYTPTTVYVPKYPFTGYQAVNTAYTLNSVQDENGNAVSFGHTCASGQALLCDTFTVAAAGATTTYQYAPTTASPNPSTIVRPAYHLRSWSMPSTPTEAEQTIVYDELFRVKSILEPNGSTTTYLPGGLLGTELYRPGRKRDAFGEATNVFDGNHNLVLAVDELGRSARSVLDGSNRPVRSIAPEANEQRPTYDLRGNVLQETSIPKPGSSLANIITSTTYTGDPTQTPWDCVSMKTCNKPAYVIDAKGNRTNYTYCTPSNADCTIDTGQIRKITTGLDTNGNCAVASVCPETTFGYSPFTGTDGSTFYLLTSKTEKVSSSRNLVANYSYDASNKFVLKEVLVDPNGLKLRTCFKFDSSGNLISKTEPNAGLASCP
jgi:hypothetical protein